ncbi:MAG TPA: hotdog domain-containing protein, partial [Vicinamibacteria bacterium]
AFFAANSRVPEVLVLTVSFTVHFVRPVQEGELRAVGRLRHQGGRLLLAEAELLDAAGALLGQGSGLFSRSQIPLEPGIGYR